ncbi:dTDP-4-dehydrorhamnose 3,5-epimerase [Candidatus Uhrbacteria bacterium]|nr:dTDP-4-dehydrorhamnose 3,5-epimerase [Candidatus Uhrbacteria bacterium]
MITEMYLRGVFLIEPKVFGDTRGYFFESYNKKEMNEAVGRCNEFVQDNRSYSMFGTLRGLHFQKPPHAQAKIVTVLKGRVLDVAVDIRKGSPTFGKHIAVELTEENKLQIYIPRGFAHGFVVLSESAEFFYKCDNGYEPASEEGIAYNDSILGIDWGIPHDQLVISEKDKRWRSLGELDAPFYYEEQMYGT